MIYRQPVPREVFDRVNEAFSIVVDSPILVTSLSTLARGVSQFKIGNFSTALVLAWFVVELALNQRWEHFLDTRKTFPDGSKRIDAERRKTFGGRDYPLSVISNMLELTDSLGFDVYSRVDRVRGYRNKAIHLDPDFDCTSTHASEALQLALDLAISESPLKMRWNSTLSLHT